MPPHPTPQNYQIFDPWNSASTGHQRAENPYSATTAWRTTRAEKLSRQFLSGDCLEDNAEEGGRKTGGPGEWKWVDEEEIKRSQLGCDIRSFMGGGKKRGVERDTVDGKEKNKKEKPLSGTTIYINGSTMPLISDHRLKHLLVANGATIAISLARRSVTHVIVGKPNTGAGKGVGAGGGLAATKLQSEIDRCARGVKVVGAEWALESIKASKRLSETGFALNLAPKGQLSIAGMFKKK
ncbi:hypothetical protein ASPWEDRAFT_53560 [Aspergillus wentii DTO 134E9]|uniref:BRCT domain-containing protein n=1 Tax=Aspergillus wentii DTO 134E9 TaxID=1073089 RepID=A0A1L9R9Z3_ASPWE|nr:uncharacterized protein ASPWEDRAFT_53560 [Aspergillus wentii DTO 134E9]OJJ31744.1 hypothetical protein ASPWEDRAFT_53560 [Aspergillus wentii DTO 134E9]